MEEFQKQGVETSSTPQEKTYTQQDVDNIVAKAKEHLHAKYEKTHIARSEYDKLESQLFEFQKETRTKAIKDAYLQSGGIDAYFNDFLKLNDDLLTSKEDVDLSKRLDKYVGAKASTNPNDFLATHNNAFTPKGIDYNNDPFAVITGKNNKKG